MCNLYLKIVSFLFAVFLSKQLGSEQFIRWFFYEILKRINVCVKRSYCHIAYYISYIILALNRFPRNPDRTSFILFYSYNLCTKYKHPLQSSKFKIKNIEYVFTENHSKLNSSDFNTNTALAKLFYYVVDSTFRK